MIFAEFFFDTTNCENTDGDAASDSCLGRGVILQTRSRRTGQGQNLFASMQNSTRFLDPKHVIALTWLKFESNRHFIAWEQVSTHNTCVLQPELKSFLIENISLHFKKRTPKQRVNWSHCQRTHYYPAHPFEIQSFESKAIYLSLLFVHLFCTKNDQCNGLWGPVE